MLSSLRKQEKLTNSQFYEIYPSDAVPPRMYGMLKAHKPQKQYPMRLVVSTIGSPMHGVSKHLVKLIQPVLNKNESRLKYSSTFVEKAKNCGQYLIMKYKCSMMLLLCTHLYPSRKL